MVGENLPTCGDSWHKLRSGLSINDFKNSKYYNKNIFR